MFKEPNFMKIKCREKNGEPSSQKTNSQEKILNKFSKSFSYSILSITPNHDSLMMENYVNHNSDINLSGSN